MIPGDNLQNGRRAPVFCELPQVRRRLTDLYLTDDASRHCLLVLSLCRYWEGLDWLAAKLSHGRILHEGTGCSVAMTPDGVGVAVVTRDDGTAERLATLRARTACVVAEGRAAQLWVEDLPTTADDALKLLDMLTK